MGSILFKAAYKWFNLLCILLDCCYYFLFGQSFPRRRTLMNIRLFQVFGIDQIKVYSNRSIGTFLIPLNSLDFSKIFS
jgi:hypothetical protein